MAMRDYVGIAEKYARDVISGKIVACHWVKQACLRQLDDLANGVPGFQFSVAFASRACVFIEHLRHIKGALAGTRIILEPWQIFILTTVFGWVDGEKKRRFRHVYIEVPRGNGKSALSSGVALYALAADGEGGAECYTFATTRDQARIVFDTSKAMVSMSPDLAREFGLTKQAHSVTVMKSGSVLMPKSAEGSTLDGLNTHIAVIDELHAHKTRELYDVVVTSLGKRRQPLLWVITTAGFDNAGICYEVRTMVTRVLDRTVIDDAQFGIIYTIDPDDDWRTEAALKKANPNWGVSVMPAEVMRLQRTAMELPSSQNNFKTKHLDVWCSASAAWMDSNAWAACEDTGLDLADFEGCPCWIGLDLAAKNDITAKVRLFPYKDGFAVFAEYYLPKISIEKATNSQYSGWEIEGRLTATDGAMTDMKVVEEGLREDLSRFDVQAIGFDPWNALSLSTSLANDGAPMVEYRNTVEKFSDPMKRVEAMVQGGKLRHGDDPVMRWMMGNVVAKRDAKDNIFPRKERYENKIDGVVALIMAVGLAGVPEEKGNFEGIEDLEESLFLAF